MKKSISFIAAAFIGVSVILSGCAAAAQTGGEASQSAAVQTGEGAGQGDANQANGGNGQGSGDQTGGGNGQGSGDQTSGNGQGSGDQTGGGNGQDSADQTGGGNGQDSGNQTGDGNGQGSGNQTGDGGGQGSGSSPNGSADETGSSALSNGKPLAENTLTCQAGVRVGALKGPTSMGLVSLMDRASKGETSNIYEFTMAGKADELVGKIANGDLDIALLPANVASVLYSKTQGNVTVLDINTLGVLYVVASDESIASMSDLKGKTIYMTGKGTTPEYVMNYLLEENGVPVSQVDLQFKSEAAEVASILKADPTAIGVLPQPFATAACIQNEKLKTVLDLTEQWNILNKESGSMLVTGVTLVRSDFQRENRDAIKAFLEDHQASAAFTAEQPDQAAGLIAAKGIVEKAPIAKKALPYCNIVCITGQEMKDALSGYLSVLYKQDPKSVGGELPGDDFYYMPQITAGN